MNNILVFLESLEKYKVYIRKVLERFQQAGLQANLKKYKFYITETKFLGFIVSIIGICLDPRKLEVVHYWLASTKVKEVQSFLEFCNFYRQFICNYSQIACPLTNLTKKEPLFIQTEDCQQAFNKLKQHLLEESILIYFYYS